MKIKARHIKMGRMAWRACGWCEIDDNGIRWWKLHNWHCAAKGKHQ